MDNPCWRNPTQDQWLIGGNLDIVEPWRTLVIRSFETFQLKSFSSTFTSTPLFLVNLSGFVVQIYIYRGVSCVCTEQCLQFYSFKAALASKFPFQLKRGEKTKRILIVEKQTCIFKTEVIQKKNGTRPFNFSLSLYLHIHILHEDRI